MHINEDIIKNVVAQVLAEVGPIPEVSSSSYAGRHGIFDCAEAVSYTHLRAHET